MRNATSGACCANANAASSQKSTGLAGGPAKLKKHNDRKGRWETNACHKEIRSSLGSCSESNVRLFLAAATSAAGVRFAGERPPSPSSTFSSGARQIYAWRPVVRVISAARCDLQGKCGTVLGPPLCLSPTSH
jgi:hypothetical protein